METMDQVTKAKVSAAIRLANDQDRFAASIRNAQMVGLTNEEIGRVTGLLAEDVARLLELWGLDS